ncbi:MAG: GDP-mannose 4,6-dehydratase [Candidatus Eiseniibacteriota bacterium]|nr:MAG: GDP-mannose 4,6-dehydratase [Candidatus Eisenbacteria bacterium]
MKATVLITGALGFVGRHLYRELEDSGYDAWASDLPASCRDAGPHFDARKVMACDVTEGEGLLQLLKESSPGAVVHLAAQSSASRSFERAQETFLVNSVGSMNVFEAVRRACPDCLVLAVGSADAYGPHEGKRALDESTPFVPVSPYALSKAAQDLMGVQYFRAQGLKVFRTRSFNHTGPGQTTTFALPSFASQIAAAEAGLGEPVIEVGNLEVVRDFLDVRDVVRAYRLILERGTPGEAYNVCSGRPVELKSMLDTLVSLSRVKIAIKESPARLRPADIPFLLGDNSKLRASTGWEPRVPMEQTLSELLEYWRARTGESSPSASHKREAR